jgi:hypothetical protein
MKSPTNNIFTNTYVRVTSLLVKIKADNLQKTLQKGLKRWTFLDWVNSHNMGIDVIYREPLSEQIYLTAHLLSNLYT